MKLIIILVITLTIGKANPLWVTLGCCLWNVDIFIPYFIKNEDDATITPNGDMYLLQHDNRFFLYLLFAVLMWTMFAFNRMVQLATYLMPQSIYCFKRLISRNVWS